MAVASVPSAPTLHLRAGELHVRLVLEDLAQDAAQMLATLLEKYDGNEEAALTYYNAGGNMAAHVRRYGHAEARRRGLLTFSQSSTYAPKVLRYKRKFDAGWHPEQDD